jgi:hypothetical protein
MTTVIILFIVALALFAWSATTTCSLAEFRPKATLHSQLAGQTGYDQLVRALLALPGVRRLESDDGGVLVSVMPVLSSLGRGYGLFVVVRQDGDKVLLLGRPRLPLPTSNTPAALRELERAARTTT